MNPQENLELKLFEKGLPEDNHCSNIYNNMRYRGWYRFELTEGFNTHTICIFRLPAALPLYDDILRRFSPEERLVGLHRMLAGKELREEMDSILALYNNNINEYVASLDNSQVTELLGRLQKIVTFDCNKIPYLHIKLLRDDPTYQVDVDSEIKKHIQSLPNYLEIFYDTLNEKIDLEKAKTVSNGVIYNEYLDINAKRLN